MRKLRHTGAGAGVGCCVCNLPVALTPDDPKGPLTPCLRLHPPPRLPRPQGLPLLQERRRHRLLSIHVPAEGRAGCSPGQKPDQEPGGATPQVSKGPGGRGRLGGAGEGALRLPSVGPGPRLTVLGRGRRGASPLPERRLECPPTLWGRHKGSRAAGQQGCEMEVGAPMPTVLGTAPEGWGRLKSFQRRE